MRATIRIKLTEEEDRLLAGLRVSTTACQRTRDRAHLIRLKAQGWSTRLRFAHFQGGSSDCGPRRV